MSTRPHDKSRTMKTNQPIPPKETNATKQETSGGRCASACSPSDTPETDDMASMRRTHQEWQTHSEKLERDRDALRFLLQRTHYNLIGRHGWGDPDAVLIGEVMGWDSGNALENADVEARDQ